MEKSINVKGKAAIASLLLMMVMTTSCTTLKEAGTYGRRTSVINTAEYDFGYDRFRFSFYYMEKPKKTEPGWYLRVSTRKLHDDNPYMVTVRLKDGTPVNLKELEEGQAPTEGRDGLIGSRLYNRTFALDTGTTAEMKKSTVKDTRISVSRVLTSQDESEYFTQW